MNNERFRQGETIEFTLTDDDITADTGMITISQDGDIFAQVTEDFEVIDGIAVVTLRIDEDLEMGDYEYMFTVVYTDGFKSKLPDTSKCEEDDEDCALPVLTICEANDVPETS